MEHKINLFEPSPLLGGYALSVRDDWTYKIKKVSITNDEKLKYEEKFGDKIITYSVFFDWWTKLNKIGDYASDKDTFKAF